MRRERAGQFGGCCRGTQGHIWLSDVQKALFLLWISCSLVCMGARLAAHLFQAKALAAHFVHVIHRLVGVLWATPGWRVEHHISLHMFNGAAQG